MEDRKDGLRAGVVRIVPADVREVEGVREIRERLKERYEDRIRRGWSYSFDGRARVNLRGDSTARHNRAAERLHELARSRVTELSESIPPGMRKDVHALARNGARLAGPSSEHAIDEMAAEVLEAAPWMRGAAEVVWRAGLERSGAGLPGLVFPPLLLAGPPGVGKSHWARELGKVTGLPVRMIEAAAGGASFRVAGMERGWRNAEPSVPVSEILEKRVANPVMIVDEIDKSPADKSGSAAASVSTISQGLLQLLERSTAAAHECTFLRIPFDLSHVNWILTANYIDRLAPELVSRCIVVRVDRLSTRDARILLERQGLTESEAVLVVDELYDEILAGRVTARHLARIRPPAPGRILQ